MLTSGGEGLNGGYPLIKCVIFLRKDFLGSKRKELQPNWFRVPIRRAKKTAPTSEGLSMDKTSFATLLNRGMIS